MILDEIVGKRKEQLARELQRTDRETMRKLALRTEREVYSFPDALKTGRLSIIAEVKKASPRSRLSVQTFIRSSRQLLMNVPEQMRFPA